MTEAPKPEDPKQEELRLIDEVTTLKDSIARANLASSPDLYFPIEDLTQLDKLSPVLVISADIDFPEARNRASIQISGRGEWLIDNGASNPTKLDHVLEDYALATRPDFLALSKEFWAKRKFVANDSEDDALSVKHYEKIDSYIATNRIPLLRGLKDALQTTLTGFITSPTTSSQEH